MNEPETIDISKLSEGDIIKNYKELCRILNIGTKTGKSKQLQLKNIERYINYEKHGNKFIIKQIYNKPKEKINKRHDGIYIEFIQLLILDLLARKNQEYLTISRNQLMQAVGIINQDYSPAGEHPLRLAQYTNMNEMVVYDFYNRTKGNFKKMVETALKRLYDRRIISYDIVTKVSYTGRKTSIANDEEKKIIQWCEKTALLKFKKLGITSIPQLRTSKYWRQYKKIVSELLHNHKDNKKHIEFYYSAYKISVLQEYIDEELNDIADLILKDFKREENRNELNSIVCINLLKSAKERHKNAWKSKKWGVYRARNDYLDKIERLIDLLIDNTKQDSIIPDLLSIKLKKDPFTDKTKVEEIEEEIKTI